MFFAASWRVGNCCFMMSTHPSHSNVQQRFLMNSGLTHMSSGVQWRRTLTLPEPSFLLANTCTQRTNTRSRITESDAKKFQQHIQKTQSKLLFFRSGCFAFCAAVVAASDVAARKSHTQTCQEDAKRKKSFTKHNATQI